MFVSATKKKENRKGDIFLHSHKRCKSLRKCTHFSERFAQYLYFLKMRIHVKSPQRDLPLLFFFNNLHFDHVLRSTPHVWKYSIELSIFARTLNVCPTTLHTLANPALIYDGQEALKIIQSSVHCRPRDLVETHLYSSFRVYSDFSNFRFGFSSSFLPLLCPLNPPETETPDDAAH